MTTQSLKLNSDGSFALIYDSTSSYCGHLVPLAVSLEGDGLVFNEIGLLTDGIITGYTIREVDMSDARPVMVGADLSLPALSPHDVLYKEVLYGDLGEQGMAYFTFSRFASDFLTLRDTAAHNGISPDSYLETGASDETVNGTTQSDVIDLVGQNVVVHTRGGADMVTASEATGRVYVNLGGGDDVFERTYYGAPIRPDPEGLEQSRIWGAGGNDTIRTGAADDRLFGGTGRDHLASSEGADLLKGGAGADILIADDDNDLLYGGEGRDVLWAGQGDDRLWGGAGADAFLFNLTDDYHDREQGRNLIRDFNMEEDFLWIVEGYNGNDWGAQDEYDAFMAGASQRDWGVLYCAGDYYIAISNVTLDDFTTEHFVEAYLSNGADFGYSSWADLNTDDWTMTG